MPPFSIRKLLRTINIIPGDLDDTYRGLKLMRKVIYKIVLQFKHSLINVEIAVNQVGHDSQHQVYTYHPSHHGQETAVDFRLQERPAGTEINLIVGQCAG